MFDAFKHGVQVSCQQIEFITAIRRFDALSEIARRNPSGGLVDCVDAL